MSLTLGGGRGTGQPVSGEIVVLPRTFTFFGGVDWLSGRLTLGDPALDAVSVAGRILVFRSPSGGQGTAWKIAEMAARGTAPCAIVVYRSNPVLVSGCVLARLPLLADLPQDPTLLLRTGERLRVDPGAGILERID